MRCLHAASGRVVIFGVLLLSGCAIFGGGEKTTIWFHEQVDDALPVTHRREVTVPISRLQISVSPRPTLTEKDLDAAEVVETSGGLAILLRFDSHGTNALDQMTTRGRGHYIVIFLNGDPLVAWLVDRRLSLGQFLLEANLTAYQTREIVKDLNKQAKKNKSW